VALLLAELACLSRAVAGRMSFLAAEIACTSEGALDAGIGTVRLVVADLAAVVALASQASALGLVRAFASEVTFLIAAVGYWLDRAFGDVDSMITTCGMHHHHPRRRLMQHRLHCYRHRPSCRR
jgi:hypothetical protein